tara:strand:+ start:6504 stop:6911 length:408 start_codon:yes stop_codon:yes gene_type:complete
MANAGTSAVKIIDNDNDVVSVTNNKLDVNATLVAGASIDIGDVEITGHSTIASGQNDTVGTSAEVLTSSTACKHVDIMAAVANTGIIYVGGSGVTAATGIALYAGDVYSIDIDNLNDVYVIATVDGENVQYTYYN